MSIIKVNVELKSYYKNVIYKRSHVRNEKAALVNTKPMRTPITSMYASPQLIGLYAPSYHYCHEVSVISGE